jgi:hypothetical protein
MLSKSIVLLSTIALLLPTVFFMFASPPLLVLKHDTPQDARVIRTLFHIYYTLVVIVAGLGALGQALVGRTAHALAMAGVAVFVLGLRRWIIPRMDVLRGTIPQGDASAVSRFRQLHMAGIVLNMAQLVVVVWGIAPMAAA